MLGSKTLSVVVAMTLSLTSLSADALQPLEAELITYTAQKYRVDFNAQTEQGKSELSNEYQKNMKLSSTLLSGVMKDDIDYHVASRLLAIDIWAKKLMQSVQVSDTQLQELYTQVKPKKVPAYRLRNILYKTEAEADKAMKLLSTLKEAKQLAKFKTLAKSESKDSLSSKNEGEIGWVDLNKFDPSLQATLKEKKAGNIFKLNMNNVGSQIIMIEEIRPEKEVSFEEAKATLDSLARKQVLNQEIEKILQTNEGK